MEELKTIEEIQSDIKRYHLLNLSEEEKIELENEIRTAYLNLMKHSFKSYLLHGQLGVDDLLSKPASLEKLQTSIDESMKLKEVIMVDDVDEDTERQIRSSKVHYLTKIAMAHHIGKYMSVDDANSMFNTQSKPEKGDIVELLKEQSKYVYGQYNDYSEDLCLPKRAKYRQSPKDINKYVKKKRSSVKKARRNNRKKKKK